MFRCFEMILLLALYLCSSFVYAQKQIPVTILVDDNYPPYSYQINNKAVGVYIDILSAIFEKMPGYDVKMEPVPWKRGKQVMEMGEGLALAPAFYHGHDWPYLYPYSLPFFEERIIVVCRADILSPPRTKWPADYVGLTITNMPGFDGWGGEQFRELVKEGVIKYQEVHGVENNILMLGKRRADCMLAEERSFDAIFNQMMSLGRYNVKAGERHSPIRKGPTVGVDPVYIGYSEVAIMKGKYPFQYVFRKTFDSQLYQLKKSGALEQIAKTSFQLHTKLN